MPKTNKTKYALLGMLLHGPLSGYDIKKFCDSSISYFWTENYGHIYPILKRLEADRLVKKAVVRRLRRPERHVYTLTDKGREAVREWLAKPAEAEIRRNEFLLKIFFAGALPLKDVVRFVEVEKLRTEELLGHYEQIEQKGGGKIREGGKIRFDRLTLRGGKKVAAARYQWCEEVLKELTRENERSPRQDREKRELVRNSRFA